MTPRPAARFHVTLRYVGGEASQRAVGCRKGQSPVWLRLSSSHQFWARHSVEQFADELEGLDVEISPPRSEQIAVRLQKSALDALRDLARAKGVGHTTLARTVLESWITRARGAIPPKSARPRVVGSRQKLPSKSGQRRTTSGGRR